MLVRLCSTILASMYYLRVHASEPCTKSCIKVARNLIKVFPKTTRTDMRDKTSGQLSSVGLLRLAHPRFSLYAQRDEVMGHG